MSNETKPTKKILPKSVKEKIEITKDVSIYIGGEYGESVVKGFGLAIGVVSALLLTGVMVPKDK